MNAVNRHGVPVRDRPANTPDQEQQALLRQLATLDTEVRELREANYVLIGEAAHWKAEAGKRQSGDIAAWEAKVAKIAAEAERYRAEAEKWRTMSRQNEKRVRINKQDLDAVTRALARLAAERGPATPEPTGAEDTGAANLAAARGTGYTTVSPALLASRSGTGAANGAESTE